MSRTRKVRCAEVWGGNSGDELHIETSGIRACMYSNPSDGGKGGDIYFFSVCESNLLTRVAIADVVGHGESVADTSEWLYESLADRMNSVAGDQVLVDLNRATASKGYKAISTAVVAAFYRGNSQFYFAYAGHHDILFRRSGSDRWEKLSPAPSDCVSGLPLGVVEDCEFEQQCLHASIGDRFFVYTDGLIEAIDEKEVVFGEARLIALLNEVSHAQLNEIRSTVLSHLVAYTGGSLDHDDVTFMIVEITNDSVEE